MLDQPTIDLIVADIEKAEFYWDRGSELSADKQLMFIKNDETACEVYDEIREMNDDYISNLERDAIRSAISTNENHIIDFLGITDDTFDVDTVLDAHFDEFREHVEIDMNFEEILGEINVRIPMYSNYDCINSHWFESQSYFEMDSYFGDVVNALNLNPQQVKQWLVKQGYDVRGAWRNLKYRENNQVVSLDDWWLEEVNRCCPACLLFYLAKIDVAQMYKSGKRLSDLFTITIPKGNAVGFYSHWQGGGSSFDATLLRDVKLQLNKDTYPHYTISVDETKGEHSIKDVYGCYDSLFGEAITWTSR